MAEPKLIRQASIDRPKYVIGPTEPIQNHYRFGKRLGEPGQFGYAIRASHKKSGEERAVKVISKARFARCSPQDQKFHYDQLRGEIDVMKNMDHENIIKFYEVFENEVELFIVMELCVGKELFDRIKLKGNYSEKDAAETLRMICRGLAYMHGKGIAHCDLKPDNFLYLNANDNSPIKIIDFGMSKFVKRRQYFNVICGTPYYVAPEVIEHKYTMHCDMWSMGVVMFVMLFGYPPFYADQEKHGELTDEVIFSMIKRGFEPIVKDGYGAHFPKVIPCSPGARDLMAKLLTKDPSRRLSASEALEHPWLTGATASTTPMVASVLSNLSAFTGTCKFKQAVLNLFVDQLSSEELAGLQRTFQTIDANGDGKITMDEMKAAMAKSASGELKLNIAEGELERLMKMADVDGDGALSYTELVQSCVNKKLAAKEERLWEAFCKLDVNGDGCVTAQEIEQVLGNSAHAKELIQEIDANGDGTVDYEEFLSMWSEKATKQGLVPPTQAPKAEEKKST